MSAFTNHLIRDLILHPSNRISTNAISSSAELLTSDNLVLVDASSGSVNITMPDPATTMGVLFTIKKIDSSSYRVTILPNGLETIDGSPFIYTDVQWTSITLVSDGSNYFIA